MEVSFHITIDVDFGQNTEIFFLQFFTKSAYTEVWAETGENFLLNDNWKLKVVDYLNKPPVVCG